MLIEILAGDLIDCQLLTGRCKGHLGFERCTVSIAGMKLPTIHLPKPHPVPIKMRQANLLCPKHHDLLKTLEYSIFLTYLLKGKRFYWADLKGKDNQNECNL